MINLDGVTQNEARNVSSVTFTHETTHLKQYLLVGICNDGGKTVSTVTYGGTALAILMTYSRGPVQHSLWGVANPKMGKNSVVITASGVCNLQIGAAAIASGQVMDDLKLGGIP